MFMKMLKIYLKELAFGLLIALLTCVNILILCNCFTITNYWYGYIGEIACIIVPFVLVQRIRDRWNNRKSENNK